MSERNMTNNVGKSTVQASNAASNTHTRPNSCFKVSDVLSLSFGVFMSCRRVRVSTRGVSCSYSRDRPPCTAKSQHYTLL